MQAKIELHEAFPNTRECCAVIIFLHGVFLRMREVSERRHETIEELKYIEIPVKFFKVFFGIRYTYYIQKMVKYGILRPIYKYDEEGNKIVKSAAYQFKKIKRSDFLIHNQNKKENRTEAKRKFIQYENSLDSKENCAKILKGNLSRTKLRNAKIPVRVKVDRFGYRFHTWITRMPSFQRLALKIDREAVGEIDIPQCQMRLLIMLLKEMNMGHDFIEFMDAGNDIYNFFAGEMYITRHEAKRQVLRMLFGRSDSKMAKFFYRYFPDMQKPLTIIKEEYDPTNPSKRKKYSILARKLQVMESAMLREVIIECESAGIPVLTVHDSIVVKRKDMERAYGIFLNIAHEYTDVEQLRMEIRDGLKYKKIPPPDIPIAA